jgi:hypothetical protein
MIPISSAVSGGLVWSKIPHKRGYELKRKAEIVGSLQRMSFWSSEVEAESRHGNWRFRRAGFFRTGTEIVEADTNIQVATLKPKWHGGGILVFSDGQTFRITCKGFWQPVWTVFADNSRPVLSIHSRNKTVELPNEIHLSEDRLILLVIFAWHIMQQASEDAASVAAAVAATT